MWSENWGTMVWGLGGTPIPTMEVWGLVFLGLALFGTVAYLGRRRAGTLPTLVLGLAVSVSVTALASSLTIPNAFSNGTVADADEVNANFSAVKTAVDDNDARMTAIETIGGTFFPTTCGPDWAFNSVDAAGQVTCTRTATNCLAGEFMEGDGTCDPIPVDTNTNAATICSPGQLLNGDGTCNPIPVDTNTNAATICSPGELLNGDGTCDPIPVDTNTNAATICSPGQLLNGDGTCDPIPVDTNTNAATICSPGQFLNGDGSCDSGVLVPVLGSNTAVGSEALLSNTTGVQNSAFGSGALRSNNVGNSNSALGTSALFDNTTGIDNVAIGMQALRFTVSGDQNVAVGRNALLFSTGDLNIGVGTSAGSNKTSGNNNVYIANNGAADTTESNAIRIGNTQHQEAFVGGIFDSVPVAASANVVIGSNDQLSIISSSKRFKEDIEELGSTSERVLGLRPVSFRYKRDGASDPRPIEFGLIAEEVAETMPELVIYDDDGLPRTVMYRQLSTLLLNEVKKMAEAQAETRRALKQMQARNEELAARLSDFEKAAAQPDVSVASVD